jgi:hypothetical protein
VFLCGSRPTNAICGSTAQLFEILETDTGRDSKRNGHAAAPTYLPAEGEPGRGLARSFVNEKVISAHLRAHPHHRAGTEPETRNSELRTKKLVQASARFQHGNFKP